MTVETLKSLIEHEFDRVNNISEFKSEVFRLIELYDKENDKYKCKADKVFSEKCGLKIEERELSEEERWRIRFDYYPKNKQFPWDRMELPSHRFLDDFNIPRRLITITYKDKTIMSHE